MKNFLNLIFSLTLAFSIAIGFTITPSEAQDWSALRGNDGQGVAVGSGRFDSSGVQLKTRWKKKLGSGYSSVVIENGRAFTMYTSGDEDKLSCFDTENGNTVWEFSLDKKFKGENGSFDGPISTPAVFDGHIYGLSCQGRFVCVNVASGDLVWERSLTKDYNSTQPLYGFASSPLIASDSVILQVGAPEKMLVAFDLKTGDEKWACGSDQINSQSPTLIVMDGRNILLAAGGKNLIGVDPASGTILFDFEHKAGNGMAMVPVNIGDDKILLTLDDAFSKAVHLTASDNGELTATEAWQHRSIKNTYNIPVFNNNLVFGFSTRILTCIDPKSGKPYWKSRKPGDGFLIVVDHHLVIATKEGSLHLATATSDNYNEVSQLDLFEDLVWTVPSFAEGAIFIRSLGEIACVDVISKDSAGIASNQAESLPLGPSFRQFLDRVRKENDATARKEILDSFLEQQPSFPILESGVAHFVYRGPEDDVALACDAFGARQERKMVPVPGTDLKYFTLKLEDDQRLNYAFLVDFQPQLDELNPRKMTSSMYAGEMEFAVRLRNSAPLEMSWFGMPNWKEPDYLKTLPDSLNGSLETRTLEGGEDLGPPLPLSIYLPADYADENKRFPVVYVFAAPGMQTSQFVESADHLFSDPKNGMRPAILVVAQGRTMPKTEERLIPFIDKEFRTIAERDSRSLVGFGFSAGSAFGALANRPEWFGAISAQSPLVFDIQSVLGPTEKLTEPTRIYLEWGRYDMHNPVENWDLRKSSTEIYDALRQNENVVLSGGMVNDSVDWASWRNRFDTVLTVLTQ